MKAWIGIIQKHEAYFERALNLLEHSRGQHGQDLFALIASNFKKGGYFVEIGASNGVKLSNTHVLEKLLEWDGLVVEPAKMWHRALRKNRDCAVDHRAVWRDGNQLMTFKEASVLSSLEVASKRDFHTRFARRTYDVLTVVPAQLLEDHHCPMTIDFLSIDTEGSEPEILEAFPFDRYEVKALVVEHNFSDAEPRIADFLQSKGFTQYGRELSQIDSWWIPHSHPLNSG